MGDGPLPAPLAALAPLLERWAILDDAARAERLRAADEEELAALWREVSPRLAAIDEFIAAEAGPLSDRALALGTLASAAHEARAELRLRGSSGAQ